VLAAGSWSSVVLLVAGQLERSVDRLQVGPLPDDRLERH
jgi:hypothetical protein